MAGAELVGRRVQIVISDPWDFVTVNGSERDGIIEGEGITAWRAPKLVIRLDVPLVDTSGPMQVVSGSFRHDGSTADDLLSRKVVTFNFWSEENLPSGISWRGGFLGSLQFMP